jgi:diamine N-acetyltransferase
VSGDESAPAAGTWDGALEALDVWRANTSHEDRPADGTEPVRPRPVRGGGVVELHEVTRETVRAVCRLAVGPGQRHLVAPNAVSFAEAMFAPHAWFRAITADGVPVGFLMISDDPDGATNEGRPQSFLWRFMIADGYQGNGYGRRALELLVEHVRTRPGATELLVSWVPGVGSPEPFYLAFGFVPTGEVDDGEVIARLRL